MNAAHGQRDPKRSAARTAPTWSDIKHQQTDVTLVLPVSDALQLEALLTALLHDVTSTHARTAAGRDDKRISTTVASLALVRLRDALRPYGQPMSRAESPNEPTARNAG